MGSGGDGYCDVCRSTKCTCGPVVDGELFGSRRWSNWAAARHNFKCGSVVLVRVPHPAGGYIYRLIEWGSPTCINVPSGDEDEYLCVQPPSRPFLPMLADDRPQRTVVKWFWTDVHKWVRG
jgi:hypothetical protein